MRVVDGWGGCRLVALIGIWLEVVLVVIVRLWRMVGVFGALSTAWGGAARIATFEAKTAALGATT